jgi:hypothetical protein
MRRPIIGRLGGSLSTVIIGRPIGSVRTQIGRAREFLRSDMIGFVLLLLDAMDVHL